jgi:capsular polysaccharide biosynthesis protein
MNQTPQASEKLDAVRLMQFIVKWKKQLIYIGIGSILVSFVFTLPVFMKPMFKAQTIIYPVNIQTYSKETATEQMVQLLQSEDVRMNLVSAFDLYSHYDVDSTGNYPRFEIMKRLEENISVSKTEFESIEISIIDENPKTAAAMCDSILSFVDQKAISLVRVRAYEVVKIVEKQMRDKKAEVDSLENAIKVLRTQYGITEFDNMVQGFSREYYRAVGSGGANSKLESTRKNLEEKGGEYVFLKEILWKVRGEYTSYKLSYEQALTDTRKELKFHNVISKATPPERKDSPKRTLIMLMFTAGVMLFALLVMIYQEHFKNRFEKELTASDTKKA